MRRVFRTHLISAGSILAYGCFGATAALAQDQNPASPSVPQVDANDIIVTATRREERLQTVPLAVSALSAAALDTRGINSLSDLGGGRVPGLAVSQLFGAENTVIFAIRGLAPADPSQGTFDLPVAFYLDGLNYSRAQGSGLELVTPERIEVLRGPQGQLFGRNAEAGAVQVISKRPTGLWEGDFKATVGNYGLFGAKGRLDLPSIAGFNIQLSGVYRKHDGYVKNIRNPLLQDIALATDPDSSFRFKTGNYDKDLFQLKSYGYRVAVSRQFGDLEAFYAYDDSYGRDDQGFVRHRYSEDAGTSFNPQGLSGNFSFTNFSGPGGTPVSFSQPPLDDHVPTKVPYSFLYIPFVTKTHGHLLNLTYQANDSLTLKSITGTRSVLRYGGSVNSAVVSPVISAAFEYMDSDTFSQEVQLIYDTDRFDVTAGVIYFKEDIEDERGSAQGSNCRTSGVASATCVPGSSVAVKNLHSVGGFKRSFSKSEALGAYAQATYSIGGFDIIGGLRYTDDKKKGERVIDRALGIDVPNGIGTAIRNKYSTKRFDPAFTLKYAFNDDVNIYGRYAVGYRAGGSNVRSDVFVAFQEEEMTSWEIGLKSQFWNRRITLNLAAFHNTIKNEVVILQTRLPLNPSITEAFNNPVDRKVKGLELELSVRPADGLSISGNYTYLDTTSPVFGFSPATFQVFEAPGSTYSPATGLVLPASVVAENPGGQALVFGKLGSPRHSGSLNVDYETDFGPGKLILHGDWVRSSRYLTGAPQTYVTNINASGTAQTQVANYNPGISANRINARVAYTNIPLSGSLTGEIALWAKNITDRGDASFSFNSGAAAFFFPVAPRTIGADLRVRF